VAGYVRQSTADIIPTATVRAAPINAEYNALRDAFAASGGHKHDGTSGEGEYVPLIADLDALNKVVIDTTNNRVGVFVEVSAAAVEQIRIQDGVIVPVTDNDIDLGTSSVEFKDLYLDGTAYIDTLAVHESATITSNFSVNGNTTLGNAASDTVTFTADVASSILPSADDTYDLGSSASQWRNLYIDGTANIDSLVADTADINGGTLDGVTIGGSTAAAADFTTMDASGNATVGGTLGVTGATTLASTLTVTGATALNGGLTLDTNKFTVADTTGNTAIAGTLDVTGATALGSTLDVTGATTVADFTATGTTVLPATSFGDNNITNVGNIALDSITADGSSITITGNTTFADGAYDFDIASHDTSNGLKLAGTLVTATATELNYNDTGSSVGTIVASKTVTVDGNKDVSSFRNLTATGDITAGNLVISDGGNIGSASDTNAISIASDGDVTVSQSMTVTGDLTVNGSTNTISTTNTVIEDALIELGTGTTGTPSNDAGIVIERGDSNNAFIGFDESEDKFKVGTGTFTGADTGNLTITTGTLVANIEGNLTGTVTGNASGLTGMNTAISELNVMDGDTSATSTTLADADRVVVNDAGTMKQVALTDFETYFESALDTLSNVTTVGTLNSGSITSGFGSIDNGSSAITTTGTITFGTLSDGSDSVTDIVTSVGSGSANSELPTALAVENRIQAISAISNNVTGLNATGAELNAVADVSAITIDTSTAIANNDGIAVFDSSASAIGYFDVDLLDTYFAGTTKTLTNKTLTSPTVSGLYLSDAGFIVEGSSADGNEATVTFTDPTADRTITFPDATGTVALSGATQNVDFGTITSDGLTVDGEGIISSTTTATNLSDPILQLSGSGYTANGIYGIGFHYDTDSSGTSPVFAGYQLTSGSGNTKGNLVFGTRDTTTAGDVPLIRQTIASNGDISFYEDTGITPKFFWDASAESLGIGTDSPNLHGWTAAVTLNTSSNAGYEIGQSGTKYGAFALQGDGRVQLTNFTANPLTFQTNNQERMRITSAGELLVGNSSTILDAQENEEQGVDIRPEGFVKISRSSNHPLQLARTDDGEIVKFRSNETTVGSIGAKADDFVVGSTSGSDAAFRMDGTNNQIYASDTSGSARDAAISLGASTVRWKDLYLSNAVVQDGVKATTTATTQVAIETFAHASHDGAKVVITAATSADTYVTELLIATNGTTAVATEYGQVGTGSALATYDVDISGADVRILATPASTTSTTFRVAMTLT